MSGHLSHRKSLGGLWPPKSRLFLTEKERTLDEDGDPCIILYYNCHSDSELPDNTYYGLYSTILKIQGSLRNTWRPLKDNMLNVFIIIQLIC